MQGSDKFDGEQIRGFWSAQARDHRQSPSASWSDVHVIDQEIEEISARITDGDHVLDIGCANGFSTVQLAARGKIEIRGVDYIPEMVEEAKRRLRSLDAPLSSHVEFAVGDITRLDEADGAYDKVVVVRVVINLPSWDDQLKGLKEAARVVKRGGVLLLSEATIQGWRRLNEFRREWNLPDIPMPAFNRYLDQDRVQAALASELDLVELVDFSSSYFVGTRVLKPLLIQAMGADIEVANPDMHWNRFFSKLPAAGDYGVQRLFVLQKR
jgi:ubiquinone/menaquinone biosynthesis C-methylase UbiE